MGLFRKLLGIPSFSGATNALLVEMVLPTLTDEQRRQIKNKLVSIYRNGGSPRASEESALSSISSSGRIVLLNFIALALNELGYLPPLKNEDWSVVRNPFHDETTESNLWAVSKRLKSTHGVNVSVGVGLVDFDSW